MRKLVLFILLLFSFYSFAAEQQDSVFGVVVRVASMWMYSTAQAGNTASAPPCSTIQRCIFRQNCHRRFWIVSVY